MKRTYPFVILLAAVLFLSSCGTAKTGVNSNTATPVESATSELSATATQAPTETPIPPTATSTATIAPTETSTATSTVVPAVSFWKSFYVEYGQYSQIILEFNNQSGAYYGIGTKQDGTTIDFQCTWFASPSTDISCKGDSIPINASINFILYSYATGNEVYRNTFTYKGRVPTPVGMACEAEPQWNGYIPAHQKNAGCFAVTCYQNGKVFYGNNNTCEIAWPFDWDFYHPLHPPRQ
jgi:hypothetical protein